MSKPTWCGECGGYHGDQQNEDPCACNPPDKKTATEVAIEQDPRTMLSEALNRLLRNAVIERDEALGALQRLTTAAANHKDLGGHTCAVHLEEVLLEAEAILRKHGRT